MASIKNTLNILVCILIKLSRFIIISHKVKKPYYVKLYARLRYFLEGDRPSQTNNHLFLMLSKYIFNTLNFTIAFVVSCIDKISSTWFYKKPALQKFNKKL
jgi:hypothetical protein